MTDLPCKNTDQGEISTLIERLLARAKSWSPYRDSRFGQVDAEDMAEAAQELQRLTARISDLEKPRVYPKPEDIPPGPYPGGQW